MQTEIKELSNAADFNVLMNKSLYNGIETKRFQKNNLSQIPNGFKVSLKETEYWFIVFNRINQENKVEGVISCNPSLDASHFFEEFKSTSDYLEHFQHWTSKVINLEQKKC